MTTTPLRPVKLPDPFQTGLDGGWRVIDASTLVADQTFEADVAIVGSGAGGGTAADILSAAGLRVILIEEGPLATSSSFDMREESAYPELYQESAARKTEDHAINILQGRCVGGGTTVNWTSSFRTPPSTLQHWQSHHAVKELGQADLAPWFERMEAQPAGVRAVVNPDPDRGQVSGVGVRHRIIGVRRGERWHGTTAVRPGHRLTGGRLESRSFAPRGLAIPGHQQTRYTGAGNASPGCGWLRRMPNPPDIRRCVHVYPPRTG